MLYSYVLRWFRFSNVQLANVLASKFRSLHRLCSQFSNHSGLAWDHMSNNLKTSPIRHPYFPFINTVPFLPHFQFQRHQRCISSALDLRFGRVFHSLLWILSSFISRTDWEIGVIRPIAIAQGKASVFYPCIMLIPGNLYVVQAKPPFKSFASHSRGKARAKGSYVG